MIGIFLISVTVAWFCVSVWSAQYATRNIKRGPVRLLIGSLMFSGGMVLPVIDEIVGGWQFRNLCEKESNFWIDDKKIKEQTVRITVEASAQSIEGAAVPIVFSKFSFRDSTTGEEYASHKIYRAKSGWLIRILGISEGNVPLLIPEATCRSAEGGMNIAKKYDFELVD